MQLGKLAPIALVLLSFTAISVGKVGKALLTPYHLMLMLLVGYVIVIDAKSRWYSFFSLNLLLVYLIFNNAVNYPNIRITSLIYSVAFILELMVLYNLVRRCPMHILRDTFKWINYFYVGNILIAFVLILGHIQIPAIEMLIGIVRTNAGTRPSGFSSEPSYASFVLAVSLMCFNVVNQYRMDKEAIKLITATTFGIILLSSAYGMILLVLAFVDIVRYYYASFGKDLKIIMVGSLIAVGIGGFIFVQTSSNEAITRLVEMVEVFNDPRDDMEKKMLKLKERDPSAFARVGTTYLLFGDETIDKKKYIIGFGAGAAGVAVPELMAGFLIDEGDDEFDTGIIPAFIYDYGIIGFIIMIFFWITSFKKLSIIFWLTFISLLPNANINTQLFWFVIAAYMIASMAIQQQNEIKNNPKQLELTNV